MASVSTTTTITTKGTAGEELQFEVAGSRYVDVQIVTPKGETLTARVSATDLVHGFRALENALCREVENEKRAKEPVVVTLRTYRE